jgi:hypothetical protein
MVPPVPPRRRRDEGKGTLTPRMPNHRFAVPLPRTGYAGAEPATDTAPDRDTPSDGGHTQQPTPGDDQTVHAVPRLSYLPARLLSLGFRPEHAPAFARRAMERVKS